MSFKVLICCDVTGCRQTSDVRIKTYGDFVVPKGWHRLVEPASPEEKQGALPGGFLVCPEHASIFPFKAPPTKETT
jgi:hypothetical protein